MYALFSVFWWLLFPLSGILVSAWRNWLSYRADRDAADLLRTYASNGREPPAELIARLGQR
jgi:Zn-dependent protease with chaperone function